MCPPRTDQPKADTTRTDGTEIEVKPSESCLSYQLQVNTFGFHYWWYRFFMNSTVSRSFSDATRPPNSDAQKTPNPVESHVVL